MQIICPSCKLELALGIDYHFDEFNNIICNKCEKPVFPTKIEKENLMPKVYSSDRKARMTGTPTKAMVEVPTMAYGDYGD